MVNKRMQGTLTLVDAELRKIDWFLLKPMGVIDTPSTIEQAISRYLLARKKQETELRVKVGRLVHRESAKALRIAGVTLADD